MRTPKTNLPKRSFYYACCIAAPGIAILRLFPNRAVDVIFVCFVVFGYCMCNDFFSGETPQTYKIRDRIHIVCSYLITSTLYSLAFLIAIWIIKPKALLLPYLSLVICSLSTFNQSVSLLRNGTTITIREACFLLFGPDYGTDICIYNKEDFFDCLKYYSSDDEWQAVYHKLMAKLDRYRQKGLDPYTEHFIWLEGIKWLSLDQPEWRALHLTHLDYQTHQRWVTEAILILMFCEMELGCPVATQKRKTNSVRSILKRFDRGLKTAIRIRKTKYPSTMVTIKS